MAKTTRANVEKLIKQGKPGKGATSPQGEGKPSNVPMKKPEAEKAKPKKEQVKKRLVKDLPDDFIEKIRQAIENAEEWNFGGTSAMGKGGGMIVPGAQVPKGPDAEEVDADVLSGEDEESEWTKTPQELEKEINSAIRDGLEEQRSEERKQEKAASGGEKSMGGEGKGKGGVRDRLVIEQLSGTDWAAIFKSRLTVYSSERAQYLPWNRRFTSSKMYKTKVPSKIPQKDVLPELNLIIDTSSSLSSRELGVILSEVNSALSNAKIKTLNLVMWHHQPYFFKKYDNVNPTNFSQVEDDVQTNWEGGGNGDAALYQFMLDKGLAGKFTISLTDGYIDSINDKSTKTGELARKLFDPNNTIFGIVYPHKSITVDFFNNIKSRFEGMSEVVPIFLDTTKFR